MFVFDPPDRFVAGTVGQPGQRIFFLQARKAGQVVSVVLEKVQVAVLAERLDALLDELESQGVADAPEAAPTAIDSEPLDGMRDGSSLRRGRTRSRSNSS